MTHPFSVKLPEAGIDPVKGSVWSVDRPPLSLADVSSRPWPQIVVKLDYEGWTVTDGEERRAVHDDLDAALKQGARLHARYEATSQELLLSEARLSAKDWKFELFRFVSNKDPKNTIQQELHEWRPRIGDARLTKTSSASEAARSIDRTPHLHSVRREALERIYAHDDRFSLKSLLRGDLGGVANQLLDDGLIEKVEHDGFEHSLRLTDLGRQTLDADIRGVPLAIRDRILELAEPVLQMRSKPENFRNQGLTEFYDAKPDAEKQAFLAQYLRDMRRHHRHSWSLYLGGVLNSESAVGVREGLSHDWHLAPGVARDGPEEVTLNATGVSETGAQLHNLSIALFEGHWEKNETSTLLVNTICDHQDELRLMMRSHLGLEPEMTAYAPGF